VKIGWVRPAHFAYIPLRAWVNFTRVRKHARFVREIGRVGSLDVRVHGQSRRRPIDLHAEELATLPPENWLPFRPESAERKGEILCDLRFFAIFFVGIH
jgi:hypothetical protein